MVDTPQDECQFNKNGSCLYYDVISVVLDKAIDTLSSWIDCFAFECNKDNEDAKLLLEQLKAVRNKA